MNWPSDIARTGALEIAVRQIIQESDTGYTTPVSSKSLSEDTVSYLRFLYDVLIYLEKYNSDQVSLSDEIQTSASKGFGYLLIKSLQEFKTLGRKTRSKLVRRIVASINKNKQLGDFPQLSVLSREFIQNQIDESRRRITKSKEVLKLEKGKAEELKHLCFCPEKFNFIKKERLFSLFPNYGFTRQHVTIDSVQFRATVQHVTKKLKVKFSDFYDDPGEDDNSNLYISRQFAKIFDFAKVRLKLDDTTGRPVQN
jgi:hypothetical protein